MTILTERPMEYSPEQVYDAWVSEETVVAPVTRIEKDVREGGHYRLYVETPDYTGVMHAEFLEVDAPRKLVYSWEWNNDGEKTTVAVRFLPDGDGCRVELSHGEFQKQESFDRHAFGWESYLDGLQKKLAGS